jgi:hypothetical protein
MQNGITPEEMELLQKLLFPQQGGAPPISMQPEPQPQPAPVDPAAQYNERATRYGTQADELDRQAANPYPQPKGVGEHIVSGLRAGMESFGRWGAPGGYYKQEEKRQNDFTAQNASRVARAKSLREQAQQERTEGAAVVQRGISNAHNEKQLGISEKQLGVSQGNLTLAQQREQREAAEAKRPKVGNYQPGTQVGATNPDTGVTSFTEVPGEKPELDKHVGSYTRSDGKRIDIFQKQTGTGEIYEREGSGVRETASSYQPSVPFAQLQPDARANVESVANKVASGELTPSQGLSYLGGVRSGMGIALAQALDTRRILPPAVRTANSDIERAKGLLVPVKQMIDDINKTPDLQQKAIKSVQLERYISGIGTQFARARGERGVVTDQDVNRVLGLIPGWKAANFAPQYAQQNLDLIDQAFSRDQDALLNHYFTSFGTDGQPTAPGGAAPGATAPPAGGSLVKPGGAVERLIRGGK